MTEIVINMHVEDDGKVRPGGYANRIEVKNEKQVDNFIDMATELGNKAQKQLHKDLK